MAEKTDILKEITTIPLAVAKITEISAQLVEKDSLVIKLTADVSELQKTVEASNQLKTSWETEKANLIKAHSEEVTKIKADAELSISKAKTDFEQQVAALKTETDTAKASVNAEVNKLAANKLAAIGVPDSSVKEVIMPAADSRYVTKKLL